MKDIVKKFGKYFLAVFVAVLLFLSGSITDIGQLVGVAVNPEKAIALAVELINQTPKDEVVKAVAEEGK